MSFVSSYPAVPNRGRRMRKMLRFALGRLAFHVERLLHREALR